MRDFKHQESVYISLTSPITPPRLARQGNVPRKKWGSTEINEQSYDFSLDTVKVFHLAIAQDLLNWSEIP